VFSPKVSCIQETFTLLSEFYFNISSVHHRLTHQEFYFHISSVHHRLTHQEFYFHISSVHHRLTHQKFYFRISSVHHRLTHQEFYFHISSVHHRLNSSRVFLEFNGVLPFSCIFQRRAWLIFLPPNDGGENITEAKMSRNMEKCYDH
jgi:hypothetical protein